MSLIHYQAEEARIEGVALKAIASEFGTPTYVYSRQQLEQNYSAFRFYYS